MNEFIVNIVNHIHGSALHVVFSFFQNALLKLFIISLYSVLLYFAILAAKKTLCKNFSIWFKYHLWYLNALCFVFVNFGWNSKLLDVLNDRIIVKPHVTYFIIYIALLIWFAVFIVKAWCNFKINRKINAIIQNSSEYVDSLALSSKAKGLLQVKNKVRVIVSLHIPLPASYGIYHKYILLPHDYAVRYTNAELFNILLHEYSHIKNGDTIKIRILNFTAALLWFNPIVYSLQKKFTFESELLSDNNVLYCNKSQTDAYCNLLIKECSNNRLQTASLFTDGYISVKARIESIFDNHPTKRYSGALFNLVFISLLLVNSAFYYATLNRFTISGPNKAIQIIAHRTGNGSYVEANGYFNEMPYFIEDDTMYLDKSALLSNADTLKQDGIDSLYFTVEYFTKTSPQLSLIVIGGTTIHLNSLKGIPDDDKYYCYEFEKPNPIQNTFYFLLGCL